MHAFRHTTFSAPCMCMHLLLSVSPNDGSLSLRKGAVAELLTILGVVIKRCSQLPHSHLGQTLLQLLQRSQILPMKQYSQETRRSSWLVLTLTFTFRCETTFIRDKTIFLSRKLVTWVLYAQISIYFTCTTRCKMHRILTVIISSLVLTVDLRDSTLAVWPSSRPSSSDTEDWSSAIDIYNTHTHTQNYHTKVNMRES